MCVPPLPSLVPFDGFGQPVESGITLPELREALRTELRALTPSPVTHLAWQAYLQLSRVTGNAQYMDLSANYLGNVGQLVRAEKWAQSPTPIRDCETDLDYDGLPECVLASETVFLVVRLDGGRVTAAFWSTPAGVTQGIAPISQFALGLGDPFDWRPNLGAAADPAEIAGALVDSEMPFARYHPKTALDELHLRREDGAVMKTIRLLPDGFEVHYQRQGRIVTRLPVLLEPLLMSQPGWSTAGRLEEHSLRQWKWASARGAIIAVEVEGGQLVVESALDSLEWMTTAEDPNRAYPPGHYLAYPFAIIEILGDNTVKIRITSSD